MKHNTMLKYISACAVRIRKWLPLVIFFSLITNLLTILLSVVNKQIFDGYEYLDVNILIKIILVLFLTYIIIAVFNFVSQIIQKKVSNQLRIKMQLDFYEKMQNVSYDFYLSKSSNDFYYRMFADISPLTDVYLKMVIDFPLRIIAFLFTITLMSSWSWKLTIVSISLIVLQWIITAIFISPINKNLNALMSIDQSNMHSINNDFEQIELVKQFGIERYKLNKTQIALNTHAKQDEKHSKIASAYRELIWLINGIGGVLIFTYGLFLVKNNELTLGVIIAFSTLLTYFGAALSGIIGLFIQYNKSKISYKRVEEFLSRVDIQKLQINGEEVSDSFDIKIRGLSFSYKTKKVFSNYSLDIKEGDITIINGANGSGKTTLCRILGRLLYAQNGVIYLGKQNIEDIDLNKYRQKVIYAGKVEILEDTLRRNLDINLQYNDSDILEIIEKCGLTELLKIKNWTLDYPEQITANELSQGERQKISIARAILRKPKILILDEPTANLDLITTNQIIELLKEYNEKLNMTVIITSHDKRLEDCFQNKVEL